MNGLKSLLPVRDLSMAFAVGICSLTAIPSVFAVSPQETGSRPLFEAIGAGEADVRLIPDDASAGRLLVKNLTKQPLVLKIPDAFAAIPENHPVLAQLADFGAGNFFPGQGFPGQGFAGQGQGINIGLGNGQQAGGTQALGGGNPFGPQNGGQPFGNGNGFGPQNGGQPFGNGLFRVPPKGMGKVAVTTVCLEHGKPQPNRRVVYRLVPLDQLTQNARIGAVCRLVGSGQIDQKVGQAIAWHFANNLSWDELRKMNLRISRYTGSTRMFRDFEIEKAKALAHRIEGSQTAEGESPRSEATLTVSGP